MRILFAVFLFIGSLNAQFFDAFNCDVLIEDKVLNYPFTGGFNTPQFSEADFNRDGLIDIFVFDRQGGSTMIFLRNEDNASQPFKLTKEYNRYLPLTLTNFCLVNDFNNDDVPDLFTNGFPIGIGAGVALYQGALSNNEYDFRIRRMGRSEGSENGIWNNLPFAQVYVATTDLPAIIDVDSDGDLDILSFDNGGSYVVYNRNFQIEKDLPSDTMDFNIDDFCFGKFEESGLSQEINLSNNADLCAFKSNLSGFNKNGGAHAGSTVTALDNDLDGDFDLLIGDLSYSGLVYLKNGGSPNEDHMTEVDETFPSNNLPVEMTIFLGSFNIDVDGDGLKDVLVAPNSNGIVRDKDNIWFYKNTGIDTNQFELVQRDFISDESIDFGSLSSPAFFDYNADGLMDFVVGHSGSVNLKLPLSLALFENIGSKTNPIFNLVDEDYLGFSEFSTTSSNPSPCFGDLDNDGDDDMIIGDNMGKLYYFKNIAGPNLPFQFENPIYNYMDISVGFGAKPQIIDINGDGLNDLIVGEERTNGIDLPTGEFVTGNVNYFQNIGTAEDANFISDEQVSPNTPVFGRIKVSFNINTAVAGSAAPYFFRSNNDLHAIVGSESGRMKYYRIDSNDPNASAIELNDFLGFIREGNNSSPTVFDIDNDGMLELLLGNKRGGLGFYKTNINTQTSSIVNNHESFRIVVYPNPSKDEFNIKTEGNEVVQTITVYDLLGQKVLQSKKQNEIDLGSVIAGTYFAKIETNLNLYTKKLIKTSN